MSTDYQRARASLGARLRELRTEGGLSGRELARRLSWPPSKISKLETGRQTATPADLDAWAQASGRPEAAPELRGRLRGLETGHRTWRRQMAGGHRAAQELAVAEAKHTSTTWIFEPAIVPGILQTADYARHVLTNVSDFYGTARDVEDGVRARVQRQESLYQAGKQYRIVLWEGALYVRLCPADVLAAQLDRLMAAMGMDTVTLGVVPFGAPVPLSVKHGFTVLDDRLVVVETFDTEMRLDTADDIALYGRLWAAFHRSAVHGPAAHRLLARAQGAATALPRATP